jgi:hypothetical protein
MVAQSAPDTPERSGDHLRRYYWRGMPQVHGQVTQATIHNVASALARLRTTYHHQRTINNGPFSRRLDSQMD